MPHPYSRASRRRLAAVLDQYETDVERLVECGLDLNHGRIVVQELDEIQQLKATLPQFAMDMRELVIRHVELLRSLLRRGILAAEVGEPEEISALQRRHRAAIASLRGKCLAG